MKGSAIFTGLVLLSTTLAVGCSTDTAAPVGGGGNQQLDPSDLVKPEEGKADASYLGVFLEFEFDAEVLVSGSWGVSSKIEDQLLYTIGHLNGEKAVGRLDKLEITNVQTSSEGGNTLVKYHAKLPVAWGRKDAVPETYTLKIPRDGTFTGYESFTEKYKHDCVEWGAHDVDTGSMWYYYRPNNSSCHLEEADVVTTVATVKPSGTQTTGKYPEYDQVWKDDLFKVVAIFGKYEDGATSASDAGISAYNEFVKSIKSRLSAHQLTTTPAQVPTSPGVEMPDITFEATLADGKKVQVTTLLVDNVRTAGYAFDKRYEELSGTADFIVYNGHAGLGANIRALAQKGKWVQGQYAVVFMNGCDTYAYVDSELWDDHAAVNPDDPKGTKYLDIVTNAMPAYFRSDAGATMAFVNGLLSYEQPKTYEQIFHDISSSQVVLVSGEQDNTYTPGGGGDPTPVPTWGGITESGALARGDETRFETPTLPAGRYVFSITGNGDADLYVRIGSAPTTGAYDCRPYKSDANETCEVELAADAPVHLMVRGYTESDFSLMGSSL